MKVVASYAASSSLMKQIEQGAPARSFSSADIDWMDYWIKRKLIQNERAKTPRQSPGTDRAKGLEDRHVEIGPVSILPRSPAPGCIAIGESCGARPANMPRPRWKSSASGRRVSRPKIAVAENVRAALALSRAGRRPWPRL